MKQVVVLVKDDLDGSEATEEITFSVNGETYEMDLNDEHTADFYAALDPYLAVARKVKSAKPRRKKKAATEELVPEPAAKEVREWARANGVAHSKTGRISTEVVEAYKAHRAAHLA